MIAVRARAWGVAAFGLWLALTLAAQTNELRIQEIDLVHFSHTDVGFTDHPTVCRELYRRYLDVALDTVLDSLKNRATPRFCWTAESALAVRDWWDHAPPERRRLFLKALRSGQLEVTALACNNTPFMNGAQWQSMVHWLPEEVARAQPPTVAVQNDVNGFPRAGAKVLLDAGVRRLFTGINEDSGGVPFPRPAAFWWKQPDGRRLFVWLNIGYGSGYDFFEPGEWRRGPVPRAADTCFRPPRAGEYLRSDEASVRAAHQRCVGLLRDLERRGYQHKLLTISLTSQWRFDNDPPFPPIADFIATWNRLGLKPALRFTTVGDAMERLERVLGPDAPEHAGEWTDWWANGTASAPREVTASRFAKRALEAAQSPLWGPLPAPARQTTQELLRDLCLFDEHTWGSSLSVARPYSLDTLGQFTEKSALAYRSQARAEWLLAQRARSRLVREGEGLWVANPTAAPYTGWVLMTATCLRDDYRSVEVTSSGARGELYFGPGIQPWGRPHRPEDLSREDLSGTFPDQAPRQVASFWVEQLPPHAWQRFRLSREPGHDATRVQPGPPAIETNRFNWPAAITWPGMSKALFLPGFGDLVAIKVNAFAPRWTLADIRGAGDRREQLRREKLEEVRATAEHPARLTENPHTLRFEQALEHPRLEWGTRILEVWKREPRVRLTLRINRRSSAAPEILYAAFPLPTGEVLPRLSNGGEPFVPFTDQLAGTCRDYFAIDGWAAYDTPAGHWLWVSRDVPLVAFGANPTLAGLKAPPAEVHRLLAMLFNNFWYTNFVGDSHGVMEFQFDLVWTPEQNADPAGRAAALALEPVVLINPAVPEDPRLLQRLYQP